MTVDEGRNTTPQGDILSKIEAYFDKLSPSEGRTQQQIADDLALDVPGNLLEHDLCILCTEQRPESDSAYHVTLERRNVGGVLLYNLKERG
jgi:hypothetical protein